MNFRVEVYKIHKLVLKIPQSWLYSYMKRVTVRAIRGMKHILIITLLLTSCSIQQKSTELTKINYIKLEYYKLNPKGKKNLAKHEKTTIVYNYLD